MNNNKCLLQTVSSMRRKSTKQSATIWTRHLPNLLDIKKDRNKKLPQSPLLPKKKREHEIQFPKSPTACYTFLSRSRLPRQSQCI